MNGDSDKIKIRKHCDLKLCYQNLIARFLVFLNEKIKAVFFNFFSKNGDSNKSNLENTHS